MRFVCEWCFERFEIAHSDSPYGEVLAHLSACDRRSPAMTLKQIAGLADHIATLISGREAFTCPGCGSEIHVKVGSWTSIQRQVQEHVEACGVRSAVRTFFSDK